MTIQDAAGVDGADPARTMELLWGTRQAPGRGRKPGRTVAEIVAAAIELADVDGLDGLSMRKVADALGTGTMSLYRYVRSKAELYELMADTAMGEGAPLDLTTGGWRAGLERFAKASLDGYRRHPWLLRTSLTRGLMGPNQTAALESLLAALSGIGLTGGEQMAVVGLVSGYVRGAAQQLADDAMIEQRTGVSDEQFWGEFAPLLDGYLDAERFPHLAQLWRSPVFDDVDSFAFGLRRVLDGIEALVESRS